MLGQIMPVALLGVLTASAVLVLMYRNGQGINEKTLVTNAADAAAYSGAVWSARHLNFMAYTNRAMIANHVTVGHFVSYMSWFRYVAGSVDDFETFGRYIPYVGQAISAINEVMQEWLSFTEEYAQVVVPVIDGANALYRASQMEAQASLAIGGLQDIMERTARGYDDTIRINEDGQIGDLPQQYSLPIRAELLQQQVRVPGFVQRYTAGNDDGRINELIQRAYQSDADLNNWLSRRGWNFSVPCLSFRKQGSTRHTQSEDSADWDATDRLQRRNDCSFRRRWRGMGEEGSASASEFDDNYEGVPAYYNVRERNGEPAHLSLTITALASKRQTQIGTANGYANLPVMGMANSDEPVAVLASAEAEFRRPIGLGFASLGADRDEYSNLFNPFWEAHLTRPNVARVLP